MRQAREAAGREGKGRERKGRKGEGRGGRSSITFKWGHFSLIVERSFREEALATMYSTSP